MDKDLSHVQLNINFDESNSFAKTLANGEFVVSLEINTPQKSQPFESATALLAALARRVKELDVFNTIIVTDRLQSEDGHDPVLTASLMAEVSEKPVVMTISGKGSDSKRVRDLLAKAHSSGLRNIMVVTGDRSDLEDHKHAHHYLDSVDILGLAQKSVNTFFLGAAVNPFKYNPADQYLQYFKAIRKLTSGADFLITQIGWDMKKFQELQWFLQMREVSSPIIARLMILNTDDIEKLHENISPGVTISQTFAAMLQRESKVNPAQSMMAQVTRIGLQVVGCKLLGYNGVHIAGINNHAILDMVAKEIEVNISKYTNYKDWLAAWLDFHHELSFEPHKQSYYAFTNLMSADQQFYDKEKSCISDGQFPLADSKDLVKSYLTRIMVADKSPAFIKNILKKSRFRDFDKPLNQLKYCCYLNPSACPKGLVYGPCGGSADDGGCEFGHEACFFQRVLAVANRQKRLEDLEDSVICND